MIYLVRQKTKTGKNRRNPLDSLLEWLFEIIDHDKFFFYLINQHLFMSLYGSFYLHKNISI